MARRRRRQRQRNLSNSKPNRRKRTRPGGKRFKKNFESLYGFPPSMLNKVMNRGADVQQGVQREHFQQSTPYAQGRWDDERGWVSEYRPEIQGGIDRRVSDVWGAGGLSDRAMGGMAQPYGAMYKDAPQMPGQQGLDQYRQNMSDSVYNQFMRRMEPEHDQRMAEFEQEAAERGWGVGSRVYEKEKTRREKNWQDTKDQARDRSYQLGSQEAQQMYGLGKGMRQDYLGEQKDQRYGGFTDYGMGQGLTQGPQMGLQGPGQAPNALGYGMGMAQLGSQGYWAGRQLDQQGGGGGGPEEDWVEKQRRYHEMMKGGGYGSYYTPTLDQDFMEQ